MALSGTVDWPLWAVDITLHNGQFEPNLYQTVQVRWRNKRTIGSYSIQDQPFMENLDEHEDNKWQMKNTIFSFIIWQTTLPHEVNKWQDLGKIPIGNTKLRKPWVTNLHNKSVRQVWHDSVSSGVHSQNSNTRQQPSMRKSC